VTQKTNAARLLDQMELRYELREYEVDPEDLAAEAVSCDSRFCASSGHFRRPLWIRVAKNVQLSAQAQAKFDAR
jgi:hypothetical protein